MSLDFLSCLEGFIAVADHQGFSKAARSLHIDTPVLTNQVKRLENILGKKLLQRTTRRISLTEAGKTYLIRAKKILGEIKDAKNEICNLEENPHGMLTISIPGALNSLCFVKHLQEFLVKYPKIQLQIVNEHSPIALLDGSVDLLISEMDIRDKQFTKEYLFAIRRGIYASPKYIKKYGKPKNISDLKNHNCLIVKGAIPHNEWYFGKKKIVVSGNYSATSGLNIFYAALSGVGIIWCHDAVLTNEIRKKELIEIKLDKPTAIKIYLYHRPEHRNSNIQLLAEHLKNMSVSTQDN